MKNLQATERCRRESAKGQAEKMEHTKYPHTKGSFTLPGEAGCEALTLELADQWGADVIRDSDGTRLSDEIVNAGYGIYSTICIIRDHKRDLIRAGRKWCNICIHFLFFHYCSIFL